MICLRGKHDLLTGVKYIKKKQKKKNLPDYKRSEKNVVCEKLLIRW